MTPHERIKSVLRELAVPSFELHWQQTAAGKQHAFRLNAGPVELKRCTGRAMIRAIRRTFVSNNNPP